MALPTGATAVMTNNDNQQAATISNLAPGWVRRGDVRRSDVMLDSTGELSSTWSKHPGNLFCRRFVQGCHERVQQQLESNLARCQRLATRIVIIIAEQQGRFLCAQNDNIFRQLSQAEAIASVATALQSMDPARQGRPTQKAAAQGTVAATINSTAPPPLSHAKNSDSNLPDHVSPYVIELMQTVCQFGPGILEHPGARYSQTAEPALDQRRRLLLRQRYQGAASKNMSALTFSQQLFAFWKLDVALLGVSLQSSNGAKENATTTVNGLSSSRAAASCAPSSSPLEQLVQTATSAAPIHRRKADQKVSRKVGTKTKKTKRAGRKPRPPPTTLGPWRRMERLQYLQGLQVHGTGDWTKLTAVVDTRDYTQVKSYGRYLNAKFGLSKGARPTAAVREFLELPDSS